MEKEAFKIFCELHPVEAYNLDPEKFCDFVRSTVGELTNDEIKELIESTNN